MSIRPGNTHGWLMHKRRTWWADFLHFWKLLGINIGLEALLEKEDREAE